jgi:hypothetical protein
MTEQNAEEFQGYDDIWTAILDEKVLVKLNEKIDALRQKMAQDPKVTRSSASDGKDSDGGGLADQSPSNFLLIDQVIKSETQKDLYTKLMRESKAANAGLKFDLVKAQEPDSPSERRLSSVGESQRQEESGVSDDEHQRVELSDVSNAIADNM